MARAPSRPRPPRAPTYAESRPLKPDELTRLGYSPTSGRRVARTVKRVTKTTKTWSERQTVQAGKGGMTKEAYTKEVESGRRAYADAATAERQRQARQARELKQDFPGITRAERQAIYAGYRRGQDGGRPLTKREYELLQRATRRVDPDGDPTGNLKQAMGYPTAAFPFMRVA
jgi:hypothetical protein